MIKYFSQYLSVDHVSYAILRKIEILTLGTYGLKIWASMENLLSFAISYIPRTCYASYVKAWQNCGTKLTFKHLWICDVSCKKIRMFLPFHWTE